MDQGGTGNIERRLNELKIEAAELQEQQETLLSTYSKVITALNQTQEGYGESLKFFIQRLQKEAGPIQSANVALLDLLNTAALFGGKVTQTSKQIDSLTQLTTGIESDLTAWRENTKAEIANIHQQASNSLLKKMKMFILVNAVCSIGAIAAVFYLFYRVGIFS